MLRKVVGSSQARNLLIEIADIVTIIAVDSRNVDDALRSSLTDFEDALQYFAVLAEDEPAIEAIVTRDPKGFASGTLPVLTPLEALTRLSS